MPERGIAARSRSMERRWRTPTGTRREQILLNLLGNAVKFTERGGMISVHAYIGDDGARVDVSDTGVGIAADKLGLIFDPFVQVDTSPSRRAEGTGLGLAISRDLALGMKGNLSATSELGKGTCMTLTLPHGTI